MADSAALKFDLNAGTHALGAPTFVCEGVLEPGGAIKVEKAEIKQAIHPGGVKPVTAGKGRWTEEVLNHGEFLLMSITGGIDPNPEAPAEVQFDSRFEFPHSGPLKAGEVLKGKGSFGTAGHQTTDVPAELKLL